ncbi:MAG TPA: carboxypeptidase-like regulatory domain-containing protein [Terriglobales bacterium]
MPVEGPDGARVPLLRAGFRPTGAYEVSFVFLHSGAPFARKGGSELSLPPMDVPISVLEWEVYLPEQYKVKDFGGDAISSSLFGPSGYKKWLDEDVRSIVGDEESGDASNHVPGPGLSALDVITKGGTNALAGKPNPSTLLPGQLGGVVVDPQGAIISGALVKVTSLEKGIVRIATTDSNGRWVVFGIPSGTVKIEASARGFQSAVYGATPYDASHPQEYGTRLNIGTTTETIEVEAAAPLAGALEYGKNAVGMGNSIEGKRKDQQQASANVFNLQKKVAGVLPVRVDVPRAGSSYRFARALVLDEETKLTFSYRTK